MSRMPEEEEEEEIPRGSVILRVGGRIFETSAKTLCADRNSMLAALALRWRPQNAENSAIFIDRDGDCFGDVLNYLRDGTVSQEDLVSLRKLRNEAWYFCLEGLERLCDEKIARIEKSHEIEANLLENVRNEDMSRIDAAWRKKCLELESELNDLKSKVSGYENVIAMLLNGMDLEFGGGGRASWRSASNRARNVQVFSIDDDF